MLSVLENQFGNVQGNFHKYSINIQCKLQFSLFQFIDNNLINLDEGNKSSLGKRGMKDLF